MMDDEAMTNRTRRAERRKYCWVDGAGECKARTVHVDGVRVEAQCGSVPVAPAAETTAARNVAVLGAGGERRRGALRALGRAWAQYFDALVVYEVERTAASTQGRRGSARIAAPEALGSSAREVLEGARQVSRHGHQPRQRHCKLDVVHALRFALSLCRPGDVIVFSCASRAQWARALRGLNMAF